jgi:hypothetical protein
MDGRAEAPCGGVRICSGRGHSNYLLGGEGAGNAHEAIVGFHGELEIDSETGEVLHVTYEADRVPQELNLDHATTAVDYDFADVGGQQYLLPAHSETEMRRQEQSARNDVEFRDYQKFSADSSVQYGKGK